MRRILIMALMAAAIIFTTACSKDEEKETPGAATTSFSVKTDGTVWNPTIISALYNKTEDVVIISATDAALKMITITFYGHTARTYPVDSSDKSAACGYSIGTTASYSTIFLAEPQGSVTISDFNLTSSLVSGTFSFVVQDVNGNKIALTEGKFSNVSVQIL